MIVGAIGFYRRDLTLLFVALGADGRAFDAVRPGQVRDPAAARCESDELVGGNGLIEMGTFVAILLGEIVGGLVIAIKPDGPICRRRDRHRHRHRGLSRLPRHPEAPRGRAGPSHQLESVHRDLAQPPFRARQPRRLAVDAGHLVVLVLRRDLPDAVRQLHQGCARRRRARRDAAAGDLLGRHRRRLAAVRAPVGAQGRDRPGAVRLDRPVGVRDRSLLREPRARAEQSARASTDSCASARTGASSPTWF